MGTYNEKKVEKKGDTHVTEPIVVIVRIPTHSSFLMCSVDESG